MFFYVFLSGRNLILVVRPQMRREAAHGLFLRQLFPRNLLFDQLSYCLHLHKHARKYKSRVTNTVSQG